MINIGKLTLCIVLASPLYGMQSALAPEEQSEVAEHLPFQQEVESFKIALYGEDLYNTPDHREQLPDDHFHYSQEEKEYLLKNQLPSTHPWHELVQRNECNKIMGFKAPGLPWLKSGRQRFLSHLCIDRIREKFNLVHVKVPTTYFLLDPVPATIDDITTQTKITLVQEDIPHVTDQQISLPQLQELCILLRLFNLDVGYNNIHCFGNFMYIIDAEDKSEETISSLSKLARYNLSAEARAYLIAIWDAFKKYAESQPFLLPIHRVCQSGNLPYVMILPGVSIFMNLKLCGITPILAAANAGHWHVVRYLLETYAPKGDQVSELDITTTTPTGENVLQIAARNKQTDIVRLLMDTYKAN